MLKTTGINIRNAVEEDLLDCLMLFKQFHKESKIPHTWSGSKAEQVFKASLESDTFNVIVATLDKEIIGFIVCLVYELPFAVERIATDVAWFVHKDYRNTSAAFRLLSEYEKWAKEKGAKYINLAYLENVSDLSRVYTKRGYKKAETHYTKEI